MPAIESPPATAQKRLMFRGGTLALWDRPGTEMPFVLIHGNSCSKESFRKLFESAALARHRLIALDLPGCGESDNALNPEETYSLSGLAAAALAVVDGLGLKRYALVGWSLGGHLAIEAMRQGATPAGVVLSGTPPCGPDPAEIAATFLLVPGSEALSLEHPSREQLASFLSAAYAPLAPSAEQAAAAARADGRLRHYFFENVFASPNSEPQRKTVANWRGPIALIQGRHEPFFDAAKLEELEWGNLWRGSTQWIEGAGHAPFVSHAEEYGIVLQELAAEL